MDVPPLPLPSFHGRLTEEDVDLVIVRVVGIRDGVGADKCGLCGGKEQHDMVLCPEPTLLYCPRKTLGAAWDAEGMQGDPWVPCYPEGRAPFLVLRLEHGSHQRLHRYFPPERRRGPDHPALDPVLPPASPQQAGEPPRDPWLLPFLPCSQWSWFCSVRM